MPWVDTAGVILPRLHPASNSPERADSARRRSLERNRISVSARLNRRGTFRHRSIREGATCCRSKTREPDNVLHRIEIRLP